MSDGLGLFIADDHAATLERLEPTPQSFAVSSDELSKLPREWHSIIPARNQGSFSCCVGGGLSGCFEHSNLGETGEFVRRSMWQAYISSQRACGMSGRDGGASLSGALKAAGDVGVCINDLCPMSDSYTTSIPEAALADARKHKHLTATWDARPWEKAVDWATKRTRSSSVDSGRIVIRRSMRAILLSDRASTLATDAATTVAMSADLSSSTANCICRCEIHTATTSACTASATSEKTLGPF